MSMRINMHMKIHVHTKTPMPMNIMRVKMSTGMRTATDTGMLME